MIYLIITTSIKRKFCPRPNSKKICNIRYKNGIVQHDSNDLHRKNRYTESIKSLLAHGKHKGVNELLDIKYIIQKYKIEDDDIVMKITGRYKMLNSEYIELVKNNANMFDAFVKFFNVCTRQYMHDDCVLGLFAIKCKYLLNFNYDCNKSAECEFAEHVRKYVKDKTLEVTQLNLECCFADNLQILIV